MSSNWPVRKLGDITSSLNSRRVPVSSLEPQKRQGPYRYYGASGVVDYVADFIFDGPYLLVPEDGESLRTRNTPIAFTASGKYWVNNHAHILDETEPGDRTVQALTSLFQNGDVQNLQHFAILPLYEDTDRAQRRQELAAANVSPIWYPKTDETVHEQCIEDLLICIAEGGLGG